MADRPAAVSEAMLTRTAAGIRPSSEGWYTLNLVDAAWQGASGYGRNSELEWPDTGFEQFGINVHVLEPGERNGLYHGEDAQEGFLVLSGECLLLVEGQERNLRKWDYVHTPRWTRHIFVGAGDGPCAILMVGARQGSRALEYPVEAVAQRHGAGVDRATTDPSEAYADAPDFTPQPYRPGDLGEPG